MKIAALSVPIVSGLTNTAPANEIGPQADMQKQQAMLNDAIAQAAQNFDYVMAAMKGSSTPTSVGKALDGKVNDLQNQDKLGNFEIQRLMSVFNEAETLASNIEKKKSDIDSNIARNI